MGNITRKFFFVLSAVAIALIGVNNVAQADETFVLKQKYKKGDVDRCKTVMAIEGTITVDVNIVVQETILEAKDDGTVVIETKVISSKLLVMGNEQDLPGQAPGSISVVTYDKSGKAIKKDGGSTSRGPTGMAGLARPGFLPNTPLKVGEVYKFDISQKLDEQSQSSKGSITVVGLEKASGDLKTDSIKAKIVADVVMSGPMGDMNPHTDGFIYVHPESGKMLSFKATITGMQIPNLGDAKINITRTLMKPESK